MLIMPLRHLKFSDGGAKNLEVGLIVFVSRSVVLQQFRETQSFQFREVIVKFFQCTHAGDELCCFAFRVRLDDGKQIIDGDGFIFGKV